MDKKEYIQPKVRCTAIHCCSIAAGSVKTSDNDADPNSPMMSKEFFEPIGEDTCDE